VEVIEKKQSVEVKKDKTNETPIKQKKDSREKERDSELQDKQKTDNKMVVVYPSLSVGIQM
jgi:hypothetical protein